MPCDWRPFVNWVSRHQRFMITTHVRPDGDALGSEKALAVGLRQLGKHVRIVNTDPLPSRYDFVDPDREIEKFMPPRHGAAEIADLDALIIVDTGTWGQLDAMAEFVRGLQAEKAVIDHHVTQDDLQATRFVDATVEAAGRLVYEALAALGVRLTPQIANPLFVALATDTGWFRHGNVTPATFALAHELTQAGARPDFLYQQLFERVTPARLRLMGLVLSRLVVTSNGQVAYSSLLNADYPAASATRADGEDLVNYTVGLSGTSVSLLFTEMPDGSVKTSFRSRQGLDIGRVAEQLGGGGHRQAAGATIKGTIPEVQQKVLQAVEAVVVNFTPSRQDAKSP